MDIITSQLIRSSMQYASEEMGIALRNSSYSPNIKERMDHSAALFDPKARLFAQAEHIPVHLGSLPWGLKNTVEYCEREGLQLEEGSMVVVNNPYIAGTHLNDITVVKPIFYLGRLVGFAANKAHHADVGGKVPGSISVDASTLYEEGLIVNPVYLMRDHEFVRETLTLIASNTRTPTERLGDLKAQAAANITGERRVLELISKHGLDAFLQASEIAFDYTERLLRSRIAEFEKGTYSVQDYLEHPDGRDITLRLTLKISDDSLTVDYEGTDKQVTIPLNAVLGVTLSGVHFVVRALTGDDIPMNHGAFAPVNVRVPQGCILNPTFPHPVAGGNVETSQRNADLLFLAFSKVAPNKVPAAAGGSMNNVMIGGVYKGSNWAFYETIGVGLGGRMGLDGVDGVQANMTNTMNTPIEEIERSFPILVKKYEFRVNSSGAGRFRGGSGLVRSFQFLEDSVLFTIFAERGRHEPWGLFGGANGTRTKVSLYRGGKRRSMPIKTTLVLRKDEVVKIETAGGGGYGDPRVRESSKILKDLEDGLITPSYVKRHYYTSKSSD
jgi:N-methylhydantoinase B